MGTAAQPAPATDVEYLKIIQGAISRLAQNSFQAKSWSVAIVTGILAFTSRSAQAQTCALAIFPAFCFWVLDAYYLRQERLFRALYIRAVDGTASAYSMDTRPYERDVQSWVATMFSTPLVIVHAVIGVVIGLVIIFALT